MRMGRASLLCLIVLLAGCGPHNSESPGTKAPPAGSKGLSVAMVTDAGGIDDKSFNQSAWEGLKRANTELGVKNRYLESREQSDYETNLSTLAEQGNDLVFAVGFLMEDALKNVAAAKPGVKFAIIDGNAPPTPNCASIKFREEEGCFLAGYLAGKMTKTGAIGFLGGMESALITKFESGYYAGARTARPDIRVVVKYAGSWKDLPKGTELSRRMVDQGADIIFAAAGKSGLGALDVANEKGPGYYAIGVDADQDGVHPGRVLTSMMKGVDAAVFDTVTDLKAGKWQPGERVYGIKEGGVHLSPMKYTKQDVPADVLTKLDELSKMITDGKIQVPKTAEEKMNFVPPKI